MTNHIRFAFSVGNTTHVAYNSFTSLQHFLSISYQIYILSWHISRDSHRTRMEQVHPPPHNWHSTYGTHNHHYKAKRWNPQRQFQHFLCSTRSPSLLPTIINTLQEHLHTTAIRSLSALILNKWQLETKMSPLTLAPIPPKTWKLWK